MLNQFLKKATEDLNTLLPSLSKTLPDGIISNIKDCISNDDYDGALNTISSMSLQYCAMLDHGLRQETRQMCKWYALSWVVDILPDLEWILADKKLAEFKDLMEKGDYYAAVYLLSDLGFNSDIPDEVRRTVRGLAYIMAACNLGEVVLYILGRIPEKDIMLVSEYIDANEFGLAFEHLVSIIEKGKIHIPGKIFYKLSLVANGTPEYESWLEDIKPLVLRDAHKEDS